MSVHVQTGNMLDVVVEDGRLWLRQRDGSGMVLLENPEGLRDVLTAEIKRLNPTAAPAVATNYPAAIALLRSLREASDPVEVERQKESWVALESALSGPAVATGDGEALDAVIANDPALKEAFDIQRPKSYVRRQAATPAAVAPSGAGGDKVREALLDLIPEELSGETNPNVKDHRTVQIIVTFGELRRARAALGNQ